MAQKSWNRAGCWRVLQPWRPDAGTRTNFCFHRRFWALLKLASFCIFAGTSVNFCYHRVFDLLESLNFASFCYHRHFSLLEHTTRAATAPCFCWNGQPWRAAVSPRRVCVEGRGVLQPQPGLLEPMNHFAGTSKKMLPPEFIFSRPSIFCYNHVFVAGTSTQKCFHRS